MINVLVVDDSAFMRKLISDFINEHPGMKVNDTARNGKDALKKIKKHKYSVVTLDIEMPEMGGLEALTHIMSEHPCPVVMVSSLTQEGAEQTMQAMEAGAVDFVGKPSGAISLDLHLIKEDLIFKIEAAAKVNMSAHLNKKTIPGRLPAKKTFSHTIEGKKILAIGTSTGGPKALQNVLPRLERNFPAPIFIVQHMPPAFTNSLAKRLDQLSSITIKEAVDGEVAKKGTAYIAPGGNHLKVRKMGMSLINEVTNAPPLNGHRPSVDVLFSSLAELKDYHAAALIMTGMGSDGAKGLLEMKKNKSCIAVAESKKTAIVYGMPKAAANTAKTDYNLDLDEIAPFLNQQFCRT
ncbi:chemotaxis response regulator protein-glutamate methylesterase [Alteribacillus sp. YIM 98480]|uniref:protein-glutamate methylesterase/protein-glutamine glutaminase n=1 Tax=Alteribacillus sp. YIM 98480 TaxID=2606599 RepID=UPI00131BE140|nr:chemotaxis response regulator protein-glutamate methylesterase [Alteribacillus sp. YIM 98480]